MSDDDLGLALLIRAFEQELLRLFAEGHITGTTHTCLGQEYVPVALAPLLRGGIVLSNHRGHGHYLARYRSPAELLAEILGREGALCGGYGGSQHLYRDGFCSTGVQGEGVPVALGAALHYRAAGRADLACVYIGDGTWGEGVVYEALNMASLWRAPLVVVVENNGIAQTTPTESALAGSIEKRAAAFDIPYERIEHHCVDGIRQQLATPVARVRSGEGPLVVEFRTQRLGPHSKGDDTRSTQEQAAVARAEWAAGYAARFPDQFRRIELLQADVMQQTKADVLARLLARGQEPARCG